MPARQRREGGTDVVARAEVFSASGGAAPDAALGAADGAAHRPYLGAPSPEAAKTLFLIENGVFPLALPQKWSNTGVWQCDKMVLAIAAALVRLGASGPPAIAAEPPAGAGGTPAGASITSLPARPILPSFSTNYVPRCGSWLFFSGMRVVWARAWAWL